MTQAPNIHLVRHKSLSVNFCRAFAASSGGDIVDQYTPGPWAGFGAPNLMEDLRKNIKAGHDFWFGDHAYFGRGKYFRVTKNAFQHDGRGEPDFARLRPFWEKPKPWKKTGRNILVCTQTQAYYDRFGIRNWKDDIVQRLKRHTNRPIIIREKGTDRPLLQDFDDAWAVVCCTSNVAVEAIMEGIPAITTGDCAASVMSQHDPALVEFPFYPDDDERMRWAGVLAANQFTFDEIGTPEFWEKIR